jgi:hypothetical protein
MTFYLGEVVLFAALLLTSLQVLRMRSELRRMRSFHAEFQRASPRANRGANAA